jgi:Na+/alanine symporter
MQVFYNVLNWIDGNILWGIPMIVLILVSGIFITVRSRCFQVRKFGLSLKHTVGGTVEQMKKKEKKDAYAKRAIDKMKAFIEGNYSE